MLSNFVFSPSTGQAFECPDAACSGAPPDALSGFSAIGTPPQPGATVPAFTGAAAPGICTGAILQASLADPQNTIQPFADGFRNPFGIRCAPLLHPLRGRLVATENGEDIRGARPVANALDRLRLALPDSYHGWPDRFGFFDSTQSQFNPTHFGAEASGVPPVLAFQPAPVTEPIALFAKNSAVVGFDFAPKGFGDFSGDAFIACEGDFGFTVANGIPKEGHDIVRAEFLRPAGTRVSIFVQNVNPQTGEPGGQAFVIGVDGINRPVDAKFGPDGALYLVDIGAIRDAGATGAGVLDPAHAPFVQIPGTGVIWKISFQ